MTDSTAPANYSTYWKVWATLLVLTVVMLFVDSAPILIAGICVKAFLIAAWFMHLKDERLDFIIYVAGSMAFFSAILYFLMVPDGMAM